MFGTSWDELLSPGPISPYAQMKNVPALTPQEEQTLLGSLLQKTTGALETIGNTLDLPGSMVRDVLGGQNPFDQILSPFTSENRTSGRDLLEQYGMAPQNDPTAWEMNDFLGGAAGVAAEIGLDPLTYLTFGGSAAKTLAGKAAQKAGLVGDVAKVASAKAGREIGQREAMLTSTIDDLLAAVPQTERAAKEAALANAGYDAATMGGQSLGSPLGWEIPFTNIGGAFGVGKGVADVSPGMQSYAKGLDTVGEMLASSLPVRKARMLFDPSVGGTDYRPGQKAAADVARKREEIGYKTYDEMYQHAKQLGGDAAENDSLAFYLENPSVVEMEGEAAFTRRGLTPINAETQNLLKTNVIEPQREVFQRRAELGLPYGDWTSEQGVDYAARFGTEPNKPTPGFGPTQWKEWAKKTSSDKGRDPVLDIPGGRPAVNSIASDPTLVGNGDDVLDGAERVDRVLEHFVRWDPDLADSYRADGLDPTKAYIAEVRDAVKARNRAAGEYVSDAVAAPTIKAIAEKYKLDPQSLEDALTDDLMRRNHEFASAYEPWKEFWNSKLTSPKERMDFWKDFRKAEDPVAFQGMGHKFDELADEAARRGIIPGSAPTEELWAMMHQHQSPSNLKAMLAPRPHVPNSPRWIEGQLASSDVRQAIIDGQLLEKTAVELTGDQKRMVALYDKAKGMAEYTRGVDPKKMDAGIGVFGNHVLEDNAKYLKEGRTSIANLEAIHDVFRDVATDVAGPEMVPIQDAFQFSLGENGDAAKAVETWRKSLPADKQAAGYVPQDAVKWAQKTVEMTQAPEAVNWLTGLVDNLTSGWKLGATFAPAFHVRNGVGGVIQNFLAGFTGIADSVPKMLDAQTALAGKEIKGLAERIAAFKGMTDKQATDRLMETADSLGVFQTQLGDGVSGAKATVPKPGEFAPGVVVTAIDRQNRGKILADLGDGTFRVQFTSPQTGKASESVIPRNYLTWESAGKGSVDFGGATPLERMQNRVPGRGAPVTLGGALKEAGGDLLSGVKDLPQTRTNGFPQQLNPAAMAGVGGRATDEFALAKLQRSTSQWVEGQVRLSALMGLLEKGTDPLEAKKMIDAAHVDYGNLSQFEKQYMRRAMPFYSFNRRMGEFVATQLLEKPGGPYGMAIRAANAPRQNDVFTPDYISEGTAIPLGPGRFITGLGLMHEGPLDMLATGPTALKTGKRMLQKLGSMANPLIKAPIEMATGQSLYTGRPLRDGYQFPFEGGEGAVAANMLLGNSPLGRAVSTVRKIADTRKGPGVKALNLLTGVQIADMSGGPERAKEMAVRQVNDEMMRDNPKFGKFEHIYLKKEFKGTATPAEMDMIRLQKSLMEKAKKAAKERAAQKT